MNKTRVLVVEDQTMPRQLFAMLIASSEEFELAATIDSAELVEFLTEKGHPAIGMDPIM